MAVECRFWISEIVEIARSAPEPGAELQKHLNTCPRCREHWEAQRRLTSHIAAARAGAAAVPVSPRREQVLREFDRMHRSPLRGPLVWVAAAAALVILSVGVLSRWNSGGHATPTTAAARQGTAATEEFGDDNDDFVPVPYALPLARGEFVSVERTSLQPTALARMGFPIDPAWGSEVPADVLVGQDGLPRAVRLVGTLEF